MTAFVIAMCIFCTFLGYRWGRWSRLRELVAICGSEALCRRELVTMAERTRHRNLLGLGDRGLQEFLVELDVAWHAYALADPEMLTPRAQELRKALLLVSEETRYELGGWA